MAKQKKEDTQVTKVGEGAQETTETVIPKGAIVDVAVTVVSLANDPFHKDGEEFEMAQRTAEQLQEKGWVKIKK